MNNLFEGKKILKELSLHSSLKVRTSIAMGKVKYDNQIELNQN
ncbi:hypothetical protein NO042_400020 [Flavobacterium psychrophilum]|nr:hypothetical protein DK150_60031 [Flavobacterium psychrophilum]SNB34162.1 hypothetical protein NO042_400020 [Flavobacterium psychrophilum]